MVSIFDVAVAAQKSEKKTTERDIFVPGRYFLNRHGQM